MCKQCPFENNWHWPTGALVLHVTKDLFTIYIKISIRISRLICSNWNHSQILIMFFIILCAYFKKRHHVNKVNYALNNSDTYLFSAITYTDFFVVVFDGFKFYEHLLYNLLIWVCHKSEHSIPRTLKCVLLSKLRIL